MYTSRENGVLRRFRRDHEGESGRECPNFGECAAWLANDIDPAELDHRGSPDEIRHAQLVLRRLATIYT